MNVRNLEEATYRAADELPSAEFCASVLGRVGVHLANGHFPIAIRIVAEAAEEFEQELAERRQMLLRSEADWLARPLMEFDLPVRIVNALERAGAVTMGQALQLMNAGAAIRDCGPAAEDKVWAAARERKITVARRHKALKPGGREYKGTRPLEDAAQRENFQHPNVINRGGANGM